MNDITLVVPCYNEESNILIFFEKAQELFQQLQEKYKLSYKIIFIDDGSVDTTPDLITNLCIQHPDHVSSLIFSRNFGKEAALFAGLEHSDSDYTAIIDVDLQDPLELLEKMYLGIKEEGFDCVGAKRKNRTGEPIIRSFFARCFYKIIQKLSGLDIVDGARDFRMMTRQMVDSIVSLKENNRFSKGLFPWVGFKTKWLEFENIERIHGTTKWSFIKLIFYALDGITAFSSAPLTVVSVFGIIFMLISFFTMIFVIIRKLIWGDPVAGWPSLACLILFTSGMQYLFTGILGFYIAKIYNEIKRRPHYILKSKS